VIPALLVLLLLTAPAAQQPQGNTPPEMGWTPVVSELPLVDLSGSWRFLPRDSDPMVQQWRDAAVLYEIQQLADRILLDLHPDEDARSTARAYRWDGAVEEFENGSAEVRERAFWADGGRMLVIEGRWWDPAAPRELDAYTFRYSLDGPDRLVFVQENDSGETVWIFERE